MSTADVLPPSPPATSSGSRKRTLPLFATKATTSTPDDSPASGPESCSQGSKKKVEFSPWADIHHPPVLATSSLDDSSVKPLPPSREKLSYIKSILKSTIQDERPATYFDGTADQKLSLNDIMESIVQQLSKNDNTEAIDAYQTLASAFKAYEEIPEQAVLKHKLNTIVKQLRLHLSTIDKPHPQPSDINLVTSALKVAIVLVWTPHFSSLLTDDFRSFMLDRAVAAIAEHVAPKGVITHYLHLLATQDFRPGLLNSNSRASRLVEALKGLTDHVKGNGVVVERLLVYQKLIDQARPVMKAKASHWVEYMLSGMASNITDTREKALALGRKACQAFPASSSISGSVRLALDMKQESGRTMGTWLCRRLEKMAMTKDDPTQVSQVPQIWAVILLLCNSSSMRIDAWQGLKNWLMVIQRCFNGSDSTVRIQANSAWNRFVYIARPHEASDSLAALLAKPVAAQLERATNDKPSKTSHATAISSYCNLLYYAFRPATSTSQYGRAWNEYIVKLMRPSFFEKGSGNADIASRILMSLFWDTKANTKVWNENRAHENRLMEPEELPTIDAKWTRSKCVPILGIFQLLFKYSSWGSPTASDQAYVAKAWRHFLKAIREAGSKEIKLTNEMKGATASILDFLAEMVQQHELSVGSREFERPLKEILSMLSNATYAELGISRVLEAMECEDAAFAPLFCVEILQVLQLESKHRDRSQALVSRLLGIMDSSLNLCYKRLASTSYVEVCKYLETILQVLYVWPTATVELAMETLSRGIALWLRDEDGRLALKGEQELEASPKRIDSALLCFVDAFTTALSQVSPHHLKALDVCLAAAFGSPHKLVVNRTVQSWNRTFGYSDEVEIGPLLTETIKRIVPHVDLQLPISWKENGAEPSSQPPSTYQMRLHSICTRDDGIPGPESAFKQFKAPGLERKQPEELELTGPTALSTGRVGQPLRTSKRRYDDSQIDFVAIDSSPPQPGAAESQFLTDRQKEVRDRQREDTVVTFLDLRSSPRQQNANSEPRECGIARKAATMTERPATPTLPENDGLDIEPEPSPTPRSRFSREVSEVEVPSSPPSIEDACESRDVGIDDVSSPMPDADEVEEREVKLGSPFEASNVEDQSADNNIDASDVHGLNADTETRDSAVPDSVDLVNNASQANAGHVQLEGPTSNPIPIGIEEKEEPEADDSEEVAGSAELPSSPPQQTLKAVITPPQHSARVLNSDELEELSASQLSRDLDWAAVLEPLTSPATEYRSPSPSTREAIPRQSENDPALLVQEHSILDQDLDTSEVPTDVSKSVQSQPTQKKRKRPRNGYAEPRKRKRPSRSQSQSSSSQGSNVKQEEEELLDCIEVEPSSELARSSSPPELRADAGDGFVTSRHASQSGESQHSEVTSGSTRRGRGRPRKFAAPVTKAEDSEGAQIQLDAQQGRAHRQPPQRNLSRKRSRQKLSLSPTPDPDPQERACSTTQQTQHRRALVPVVNLPLLNSGDQPVLDKMEAPMILEEQAERTRNPASPNTDVLAGLQCVLEQIKAAAPGTVDLRAIDDLCFQIRFRAQIAATGVPVVGSWE